MHELVFTKKKKKKKKEGKKEKERKAQAGTEWSNILPKSSQAGKKLAHHHQGCCVEDSSNVPVDRFSCLPCPARATVRLAFNQVPANRCMSKVTV